MEGPASKGQPQLDKTATWLESTVAWAEAGVSIILAVVIVLAIGSLVAAVVDGALSFPLDSADMFKVIKAVLDVFIVIELFRITIAYVRHGDIVSVVLETALVVAAREVVVVEAGKDNPLGGAVVALTLVAIGTTWYLLKRARAFPRPPECEMDITDPEDRE